MIRKLTHVETTRVDALCLGSAENQSHLYYDWSVEDWKWLTGKDQTPRPATSLWQKLTNWLRSL